MSDSGQKFIGRNRAPRVHISYDVETYGARKKVELPFVMGVLSELSGKSHVEKKALKDREFLEFSIDNFDRRMEAIAPRAAFAADNKLDDSGGKMAVDLTFSRMSDFSPGEVAKNVPALAKLVEARQQLADLLLAMDGKEGAEDLLDRVLKDPDLLKALSAAKPEAASGGDGEAAAEADDDSKA